MAIYFIMLAHHSVAPTSGSASVHEEAFGDDGGDDEERSIVLDDLDDLEDTDMHFNGMKGSI